MKQKRPDVEEIRSWCGNYSHYWGDCRLHFCDCTNENCPIVKYIKTLQREEDGK